MNPQPPVMRTFFGVYPLVEEDWEESGTGVGSSILYAGMGLMGLQRRTSLQQEHK